MLNGNFIGDKISRNQIIVSKFWIILHIIFHWRLNYFRLYKITYWNTKECVQYSRHCQSQPLQWPSWFHIAHCEPKRLNRAPQTIGVIYRRFRKTDRFAYQIIRSAIKHSHQTFSHQVPVSNSSFNFNGRVYDWNVLGVITQFYSDNNKTRK